MSDLCPIAVSQDSADLEDQPETIIESYLWLLKSKKYCDVTFTFGRAWPDRIQAHQFCLKARSPEFAKIFRLQQSGLVHGNEIEISECTPERFQQFLEFIYSDKLETDIAGALDLLHLAQKYKIKLLTKKCEALITATPEIKLEQSVKVFESARRYGHQELLNRASGIMVKSFKILLEIGALLNAEEETVVYLLERDDLPVEEVNLFEFILQWGRKQFRSSADEQLLKQLLKNVISKIRYTNMTPQEFTKVVVPTGLLPSKDVVSVYSYFGGDEKTRKDLKIKFNTNWRKGKVVEEVVDFFAGQQPQNLWVAAFSKHSICFKAERTQLVTKGWSDCRPKTTAITGIQLQWPDVLPVYLSNGFILNFNVSITEYYRPVDGKNFKLRFQNSFLNCKAATNSLVCVEPPVEFVPGSTYCVMVEDLSTSEKNNSHRNVDELIYGGNCFTSMNREASVDLEDTRLTLKEFYRSEKFKTTISALYGSNFVQRGAKFNVIRGIRVALM